MYAQATAESGLKLHKRWGRTTGSRGGTRTPVVLPVSARRSCPCPAAAARRTRSRCEVRERAAVLELDRHLQWLQHIRGMSRRVWVLKLRARVSTARVNLVGWRMRTVYPFWTWSKRGTGE